MMKEQNMPWITLGGRHVHVNDRGDDSGGREGAQAKKHQRALDAVQRALAARGLADEKPERPEESADSHTSRVGVKPGSPKNAVHKALETAGFRQVLPRAPGGWAEVGYGRLRREYASDEHASTKIVYHALKTGQGTDQQELRVSTTKRAGGG